MQPALNRAGHLCVVLCFAMLAACTTPPKTAPDAGRITVGVTAKGSALASVRLSVEIEPAGIRGDVNADAGTFTASNVPAGAHTVRLTRVPPRCRVDGSAERTVTVAAGRTVAIRFDLVCGGSGQPRA